MSNTKISVSESDINDDLIQQHQAAAGGKSLTIKLPKLPRPHFKKPSLRFTPLAIVVVLILLVAVGGGLGYKKYIALKKENQRLANPQAAAQDEATRVKNEVAQLIELPNETPTIATVVDVDKLKTQAFFANAQNGDKVLLFATAKKAVLYRPNTKKIVEVAPINLGSSTASSNNANSQSGVAGASTTQPTTTPAKKP